jgi:ESS family glutamate:Na+ symporter
MGDVIQVNEFVSFTIAIILLFAGKELNQRFSILRRYSIPEPVAGGLVCVAVVAGLYFLGGKQLQFDVRVREYLLLYFFACIGLKSDVATLRAGGKPLIVLSLLATVFIVLQNGVGMSVASAFGLNPKAGLMAGSISLTGGIGTTLAWAPDFVQRLGIANAMEIGVASNMMGLIAACVVGGPIAGFLMRKHRLKASDDPGLMIGTSTDEGVLPIDYFGVLRAWLWLNIALLLGSGITTMIHSIGLNLPEFVGCLLAGLLLRNVLPRLTPKSTLWKITDSKHGMALISDICLGMFLTMALMDLRLWELHGSVGFVLTAVALQIVLTVLFTVFVVFRAMGRDYEATVICAGFGGITLGSTATAVASMTAVSREYGAANRAFLVVPLVCGFFVDLINAFAINVMTR